MVKRDRSVLFEQLAGGGALARPIGCFEPCECFPGKIWFDFKTNAKVGYQQYYFDPDEGVYYLNGRKISKAAAERVDRKSIPGDWVDPRYVGADGLIRGAVPGYEWCDVCEHRQKAKLSQSAHRYRITSQSGRRSYLFTFDRFSPRFFLAAFHHLWETTRPRTDREHTEYLIFCLLFFARFSSLHDCSKPALARRFRLSKSRISSIRRRYLQRLTQPAVPPKP